jgi:hypothetical protein
MHVPWGACGFASLLVGPVLIASGAMAFVDSVRAWTRDARAGVIRFLRRYFGPLFGALYVAAGIWLPVAFFACRLAHRR